MIWRIFTTILAIVDGSQRSANDSRRAVLDQMAERLLPGDSESSSFLEAANEPAISKGSVIDGSKSNGQKWTLGGQKGR